MSVQPVQVYSSPNTVILTILVVCLCFSPLCQKSSTFDIPFCIKHSNRPSCLLFLFSQVLIGAAWSNIGNQCFILVSYSPRSKHWHICELPKMVLESTIVCVDNSEYSRNGDFAPTRFVSATIPGSKSLLALDETRKLTLSAYNILSSISNRMYKTIPSILSAQLNWIRIQRTQ